MWTPDNVNRFFFCLTSLKREQQFLLQVNSKLFEQAVILAWNSLFLVQYFVLHSFRFVARQFVSVCSSLFLTIIVFGCLVCSIFAVFFVFCHHKFYTRYGFGFLVLCVNMSSKKPKFLSLKDKCAIIEQFRSGSSVTSLAKKKALQSLLFVPLTKRVNKF